MRSGSVRPFDPSEVQKGKELCDWAMLALSGYPVRTFEYQNLLPKEAGQPALPPLDHYPPNEEEEKTWLPQKRLPLNHHESLEQHSRGLQRPAPVMEEWLDDVPDRAVGESRVFPSSSFPRQIGDGSWVLQIEPANGSKAEKDGESFLLKKGGRLAMGPRWENGQKIEYFISRE